MTLALQVGALEHVQSAAGPFRGRIARSRAADSRLDRGRDSRPVLARGDLRRNAVTAMLAIAGEGRGGRPKW